MLADYGGNLGAGATGPYLYWTDIPGALTTKGTFPGQGWVQQMAFVSPAFGWVGTSRHIYQTADQGARWTVIAAPSGSSGSAGRVPLIALGGTARSPVGWYAQGPNLWRSRTDGRTWTKLSTPWVK